MMQIKRTRASSAHGHQFNIYQGLSQKTLEKDISYSLIYSIVIEIFLVELVDLISSIYHGRLLNVIIVLDPLYLFNYRTIKTLSPHDIGGVYFKMNQNIGTITMSKEHEVTKWFQMFLYSPCLVCEPLYVIPVAFVFMYICVDVLLVDATERHCLRILFCQQISCF